MKFQIERKNSTINNKKETIPNADNKIIEYKHEQNILKEKLGRWYDIFKRYDCILAGGAITSLFTNKPINDFDIYFRNKDLLHSFLVNEADGAWVICYTNNAFTFKLDDNILIQCVYFNFFDNIYDLFNTFDFTVCMGAYDFKDENFVLDNNFLKDNSQRFLRFNSKTKYPIISALRVDKYKNKGYYISKIEYMKIMLTISKMNIEDYIELKEQLGGMYGDNYDDLIESNDTKEFCIDDVIDYLSDLEIKEKNIGKSKKEINDWDLFVDDILKYDKKYFILNNKKYRIFLR